MLSNSLALISDSFHLLSDSLGFFISYFAIKLASKPANHVYTYGWWRAEIIGVLVSVVVLWGLTAMLWMEAWDRLWKEKQVVGPVMMVTAAIGFAINLTYIFLFSLFP